MIFEFTDLKPRNPFFSLAIEEAFCYYISKQNDNGYCGGMRLWANPESVILGRTCKVEDNLLVQNPINDNFYSPTNDTIPICRRLSGGGTVYHGPGNINYSIYLSLKKWPKLYQVTESYETLLQMVRDALRIQNLVCEWRGQSDLVLVDNNKEYKISGNSQFRKYGILCLHGTLITNAELITNIKTHLKHPPKEPTYREGRSHDGFLGALPSHFEVAQFFFNLKDQLQGFTQENNMHQIPKIDLPMIYGIAKKLTRNVYTNPDWIYKGEGIAGRKRTELDKIKYSFIHTT